MPDKHFNPRGWLSRNVRSPTGLSTSSNGEDISVEHNIFDEEANSTRSAASALGLLKLSLRARHDPQARVELTETAKLASFATPPEGSGIEQESPRKVEEPDDERRKRRHRSRRRTRSTKRATSRHSSTESSEGSSRGRSRGRTHSRKSRASRGHRSRSRRPEKQGSSSATLSPEASGSSQSPQNARNADSSSPISPLKNVRSEVPRPAVSKKVEDESAVNDPSRRIDQALVRLHDAIVDNRPAKAQAAKEEISEISNQLRKHRTSRKGSSATGTTPRINLAEVQYDEITMLVSMAVSARKVCKRSTNKNAAKETLKVLKDSGALTALAQGLAEGTAQPETSGGRAIVSVLSDAASDPETRPAVTDAFKTYPPHLIRVCYGIMKDKDQPAETRNETAHMVKDVAEDPEVKDRMLAEKPDMLTLADKTIEETAHVLTRSVLVKQRKRKPKPAVVPTEEAPMSSSPGTSNMTPSVSMNNLMAMVNDNDDDDGPGDSIDLNSKEGEEVDEDELEQFLVDIERIKDQEGYLEKAKEDIPAAGEEVASLLCRSAKIAKTKKFTEADGHELLLNLAKQNEHDKVVLGSCLDAFARGSDVDPFIRDFCMRRVESEIDPKAAAQDPKAAEAYVALMTDALVRRRKRKERDGDSGDVSMALAKNLELFMMAWDECKHEHTMGLQEKMQWLKEISSDDKSGLTLKDAHQQLVQRKIMQQTMTLGEDRALRRLFDFIYESMEAYLKTPIDDVDSFLGQEIMYGCLSFQLLLDELSNESYLIEHLVPNLLFDGMKRQQDSQVAQHIILTAAEFCSRGAAMPLAFANVPDAAVIATEVVRRGLVEVSGCQPLEVEDLMKPRLELVQHMAHNRQVFGKTSIMDHLIALWNDSDRYYFGEIRNRTLEELKRLHKREKLDTRIETIGTAFKRGLGRKEDPGSPENLSPSQSPLQRRRSVIGTSTSISPAQGPLARRSSAIGLAGNSPLQRRGSAMGLGGGGQPLLRRASLLGKKEEQAPPPPSPTGLQRRASMMQRRASLVAGSSPSRGLRKQSMHSMASEMSSFEGSIFDDDDEWPMEETDQGPVMTPHILRTMRKVVCGQFIKPIKEDEVPMRLVGLVVDRETNPAILPDVLFLIGALAAVPDLKEHFGQIMAIERILDLIRRAYKHDGLHISEVVGNSCLALANLCVVHVHNTNRFNKYKGSELIVKALRKRGEYNDAKGVNGASALICNLCFKNEEMKKSLGNKGACEALVQAMRDYKSSGAEAGSRCISSMFKAIGNLALNAHNMNCFMQADIPSAYADFLEQADDELDDATLEACFRTLANLVIEKDNMEKFESSVVPVLSIIRKIQKDAPELYRWAFETIGNLCRWPESAKVFTTNEGIQSILSLLPFLPDSGSLHSSAIFVLGIQTSNKENIPILIEAGILEFAKTILDNYITQCKEFEAAGGDLHSAEQPKEGLTAPNTQLPIAALRCVRRVLATKENAAQCIASGCSKSVLNALQLSWTKSMLMYEALRVIFTMIAFYSGKEGPSSPLSPPPSPGRLTARASMVPNFQSRATKLTQAAVAMRQGSMLAQPKDASDLLSASTQFNVYGDEDEPRDRVPIGERAYEMLQFSDEDIDLLIEVTRKALGEEKVSRNLRLYRLGLGCLAYFACEKKGFDALYRRLQFEDDAEEVPIQKWDKQRRRSLQMATPKNLPLPPPDDGAKTLKKRRSIISFFKAPNKQDAEGIPGVEFGTERPRDKTSVVDLVFHALDTFVLDRLVVEEAVILLNHVVLCSTNEEELEAVADQTFYKEFKALAYKDDFLLNTAKEALKLYKFMLDKGHDATPEDMQAYYHLIDLEFPLDLSGWNDDPYPDGVQSLPTEIKQFLRQGGKLDIYTMVTVDGQRKPDKKDFFWKSTHDMLQLQWKICDPKDKQDPDPKYPHSVPISLVSGILPGITNATFAEIAKKLSISESACIGILGPKTNDFPDKLVLNLRAKGQKERDSFVHVYTVWRDAAAYGFR